MPVDPPIPLSEFPKGQRGRIARIEGGVADDINGTRVTLEQLLLDLGFEEGAAVEVRHQGPFDGPLAVNVDGRLIALRPVDAAAVLVDPQTDDHPEAQTRTV